MGIVLGLWTIGFWETKAFAQEKGPVYRIQVPLPLQAREAERIQVAIRRELQVSQTDNGLAAEPTGQITLLLEMVPDSNAGEQEWGTTPLGVAQDMADFLSGPELAGTRVVCHINIPSLSGHAILIAMATDALTAITDSEFCAPQKVQEPVRDATREIYREMAERRARIPAAVAVRLVDPNLTLLELRTDTGTQFLLSDELEAFEEHHRVDSETVLAAVGAEFRISSTQARSYGWIERCIDSEKDLCDLLGTSEIRPIGATPDAILRFWINEPISDHLTDRIRGQMGPALQHLENAKRDAGGGDTYTVLLLEIDSEGGNLSESLALADWLLSLDSKKCWTVARISGKVQSDALLIAWACRQILVTPEAQFGGDGLEAFRDPGSQARARDFLEKDICPQTGRNPAILTSLLLPHQKIGVYRNRKTGQKICFLEEDVAGLNDSADWVEEKTFSPESGTQTVVMNAEDLKTCGMSVGTADSDLAARQQLGGETVQIVELRHNFVTRSVDFLSSTWTTRICLTLAFLGLFVEIFVLPGIGLGGFLSLVFFGLFFWGKMLGGTATMLEAVLFVLGVLCILLEVFVIPGFGIFGIGGFVLVVTSIIMAMQDFLIPHSDRDWNMLEGSLWGIIGSLAVAFAGLALLNWLLPKIFAAPTPDPTTQTIARTGTSTGMGHDLDPLDDLLDGDPTRNFGVPQPGQIGVVVTPLVPAGRVEIRGQFYDVVSDGTFVEVGQQVCVVQVRGNLTIVTTVK